MRVLKRNIINYSLAVCSLIAIIISTVLFTINYKSNLAIIFGSIGLLLLVILLISLLSYKSAVKSVTDIGVINISEERRIKAEELYKQRVEEAIQIALGKKDSFSLDEKILAIKYIEGTTNDDICMICKLSLKNSKDILQCPKCESLYHRGHLEKWVVSKKRCPVCAQELYSKN